MPHRSFSKEKKKLIKPQEQHIGVLLDQFKTIEDEKKNTVEDKALKTTLLLTTVSASELMAIAKSGAQYRDAVHDEVDFRGDRFKLQPFNVIAHRIGSRRRLERMLSWHWVSAMLTYLPLLAPK